MAAEHEHGRCPGCGGTGQTGTLCPEPLCATRGYHRIPVEYLGSIGEIHDSMIGQLLGDYLLVQKVGAGSFGKVYLGVQMPIGLKAAVKLLDLDLFPDALRESLLEKFELEARALALVQHPNVLRLFQYGSYRNRPYIVTDYVDGGFTLEEEIEGRAAGGERYRLKEVGDILRQILSGLTAVHDAGIIHRDIKPANIMIQDRAGYPRMIRILDFGLAKFLERGNVTLTTSGTPDYMAPEQLTRDPLGPWTDLYAVGVLAFELLTGSKPFPGDTIQEVLFHKLNRSWDPLERVRQLGLPGELEAFLGRSLAIEPQKRFRTIDEMRPGLEVALKAMEGDQGGAAHEVSVEGLVHKSLTTDDETAIVLPLQEVRRDDSIDSDEAFRRWIEQEARRLTPKKHG